MIDSAVLVIVRTTNSTVKFDSSASFKTVPRFENFSGYGPVCIARIRELSGCSLPPLGSVSLLRILNHFVFLQD